jgi:hypothetical protein
MQKQFILLWLLFFTGVGCSPYYPADTITQSSTIDLLLAGQYDGQMTCAQLLGYGDFGIGTFDRLDGEMVLLDLRCLTDRLKSIAVISLRLSCRKTETVLPEWIFR